MATFDRGDELKQQGNLCFQKGKFHAAIDMYTEAIVMAPGRSKYYSNRALSVKALETALSSAKKPNTITFQQDIRTELQRVKKEQWHYEQKQRLVRHEEVKCQLVQLFQARQTAELVETEKEDALMAYVEHMAACFEKEMYPGEIPEYFICPISMEIMQDPVTTPNGVSYERRCLETHLQRNGEIDPLTRKQLTVDMLRPNKSLCAAIEDYLKKNVWALEY
ncbi:unnamed protein product [Peronospora farinosa]|uniref:E3 ubiquitin-protein ligase CHIP n=1 Tax=Peronospora farinosa TaxID=134698 RepID=A0AAV0T978_9STRA|nr:unnamed protein product [Peronospora farinosa]